MTDNRTKTEPRPGVFASFRPCPGRGEGGFARTRGRNDGGGGGRPPERKRAYILKRTGNNVR